MGDRIPLKLKDTGHVIPATGRKVFVAVNDRGACIGETHPNAKLSDAQVDEMRDLHELHNWDTFRLAQHFGVSYVTVRKICTYERRASTIAGWKKRLQQEDRDEIKRLRTQGMAVPEIAWKLNFSLKAVYYVLYGC